MAPALFLQRTDESGCRYSSKAKKYGRATQQFRHFGVKRGALILDNPEYEQDAAETEGDGNKATEGDSRNHHKRIHLQAPLHSAVSAAQDLA